MTENKTTNAPAPITPVRGGGAIGLSRKSPHGPEVNQVHKSSPPDWSCWLAGRSVTVGEAVALTLNIDPDSLPKKVGFITQQSFTDKGVGEIFCKRQGAIQGCFRKSNIKLSVIAEWAVLEAKWGALPPELVAIATARGALRPQEACAMTAGASAEKPWLLADPKDPKPKYQWYTPARYFARQLVVKDITLLTKRQHLADKVSQSLDNAGFKKRGGKASFRRASRYLSPDSCSHLLNIVVNRMLLDDAIALGVERDGTDGRPVARIT